MSKCLIESGPPCSRQRRGGNDEEGQKTVPAEAWGGVAGRIDQGFRVWAVRKINTEEAGSDAAGNDV